MKKILLFCAALILFTGCNNSTTVSTKTTNAAGERVVKKLTLTTPKEVTLTKGVNEKVSLTISRSNFEEAVSLEVTGLPAGVEVVEKEMTIPASSTTLALTLKATDAAVAGDSQVNVTASSSGVEKISQNFKLKVK